MNSSIWIARMYQMTEEMMGRKEAKRSITSMMSLIIHDLLEEGKEINAQNLNEQIEIYVKDFHEVYKAQNSV